MLKGVGQRRSTLTEAKNAREVKSFGTAAGRAKREGHRTIQVEALIRARPFFKRATAPTDIAGDSTLHLCGTDEVGAGCGFRIALQSAPAK